MADAPEIERVYTRVSEMAQAGFGLDFVERMKAAGRRLVVLKLTPKGNEDLSNSLTVEQLDLLPVTYGSALAGYRVDISPMVPELAADILILEDNVFNYSASRFDAIIAHELAHWVFDSDYARNIKLTPSDKSRGALLYRMTDFHNEDRTRHSEDWCVILLYAARNLVEAGIWPTIVAFLEDALPNSDRPDWRPDELAGVADVQ